MSVRLIRNDNLFYIPHCTLDKYNHKYYFPFFSEVPLNYKIYSLHDIVDIFSVYLLCVCSNRYDFDVKVSEHMSP